jgi:beta-glucosidase
MNTDAQRSAFPYPADPSPTRAVESDSPQTTQAVSEISKEVSQRIEELLSQMTLEEKVGQMTQVEKNSLPPGAVKKYFIGSVLSGGGGNPHPNTPESWLEMVSAFQREALDTRLGIPILYGVDAVHGHNNLNGAVIFPHNIGLGATRNADLVRRIGQATAQEVAATGVHWNFAPTLAVPQDIRWGRTYEGYGQDPALVAELGAAYVRGLQGANLNDPHSILANPKHFIGDGATTFGSSQMVFDLPPGTIPGATLPFKFLLDQGDARLDESTLREVHLKPYVAALDAGARIIMASFSSWNGENLHGHRYLLTEVLKGELGFTGFVVTDWGGIDHLSKDYYQAVVMAINAGIDMSMVPNDFVRFITTLKQAVANGDVPQERIDDAVRRILRVKLESGVFEHPFGDEGDLALVGSAEHRQLARRAVALSLVLLKNEGNVLPLSKSEGPVLVAGIGADNIGLQCGGWTLEWLGIQDNSIPGTTIQEAIREMVNAGVEVYYHPGGNFESVLNAGETQLKAKLGILVIAEAPYAEGFGDRAELNLQQQDIVLLERMRDQVEKLVVILLSGRPLIVSEQLPLMDALVAAWLPGTEGQGIADVLFGDVPFSGKLSFAWPRSMAEIPLSALAEAGSEGVLFPIGFGLP